MGVNAAGLKSKITSFKNVLHELKPAVFCVEETKLKDEGRIKIENYDIFEHVRKNRDGGGGLALGSLKELNGVLVRTGEDKVEALSVDLFFRNMKVRCCVAYGCQETDALEKKEDFWNYLDEEIELADQNDSGFILHFDGNLWAGEQIIPGDPKKQNRNGKMFEQFLQQHTNLTVVNSLQICEGLITRARNKDGKMEESVIDFFVVCNRVLPYVQKMVIDEKKEFVLTNYTRDKQGVKAIDTDHYTQYIDLNLEIENPKIKRIEILDFKKKKNQEKFRHLTANTTKFTKCFENLLPLQIQIQNWKTLLNASCKEAFSKIRIKKKRYLKVNNEVSELIKKRNELKSSNEIQTKDEIDRINTRISDIEALKTEHK